MKIDVADGKVSLSIEGTYTADELSKLVEQIGEARGQIAKDPPSPVGMHMKAWPTVHWYTELNEFVGAHQLSLLSPLGWQTFLLSPPDAAMLIHRLSGQIYNLMAAAAQAGANNNPDGLKPVH